MGSPPSLKRITSGKPILPVPPKKAICTSIQSVVLGNVQIKTWYPSFYSEEIIEAGTQKLYVCHDCFKYSDDVKKYLGHLAVCPRRQEGPPGAMIYDDGQSAIFEVDGAEHKSFTQNLSLFAKFFLDTKSVFYDVSTFLYYFLVRSVGPASASSPAPRRVIGFFSKEKMSWDNNNLACIVVFPPWQRRGYGQLLMGCSYELSKREGRLGGPEKPLSELGRKGYMAFWCATVARCVLGLPARKHVSVGTISEETWLLPDDIVSALKEMRVLEASGNGLMVLNKARVRSWIEDNGVDLTSPIRDDGFVEWLSAQSEGENGVMEE